MGRRDTWVELTVGLRGEDAGRQQPELVSCGRRLLVRAFAELARARVVAQLEVTSSHLVIQPRPFQRRLRHRQTHVPAVPDTTRATTVPRSTANYCIGLSALSVLLAFKAQRNHSHL